MANEKLDTIELLKTQIETLHEENERLTKENYRLRQIARHYPEGILLTNAYDTAVNWWHWLTN